MKLDIRIVPYNQIHVNRAELVAEDGGGVAWKEEGGLVLIQF